MKYAEAVDAICGVLKAAWPAQYPVKYDDVSVGAVPTADTPWARLTIAHSEGGQASLGNAEGKRRFRRRGTITINVFGLPGRGLSYHGTLATLVRDAYEGTAVGGLWFKNVRINEIGPDGHWYLVNVLADFEYDEIR